MAPAEIIAGLIACGASSDLVNSVCDLITENAVMRSRMNSDDARRGRDAQRKQLSRKSLRMSQDVTGQKPVMIEEESKKERKHTRAKALQDDFTLSETDHAFAEKHGWDLARRNAEFDRLKDHAKANGRRQVDWHAAWRTWVTSPYNNRTNGAMNGHRHPGRKTMADVLAEMRERESPDLFGVLPRE